MNTRNKKIFLALGVSIASLVLVYTLYIQQHTDPTQKVEEVTEKETYLTSAQAVPLRVSGALQPTDQIVVYAKTSGTVVSHLTEGETVTQGVRIAQLDAPVVRAQLARADARAQLNNTQAQQRTQEANVTQSTQEVSSASTQAIAELKDTANTASVRNTVTQTQTNIEQALRVAIEVLDYIETNRPLFSADGMELYRDVVIHLYGDTPDYLNNGIRYPNTYEGTPLITHIQNLQNKEGASVADVDQLAEEVHTLLARIITVLKTAEDTVFDEQRVSVLGDRYSLYTAKRGAVTTAQSTLKSSIIQLQSISDTTTEDTITQEANTAVATLTTAYTQRALSLQEQAHEQTQEVSESEKAILRAQLENTYHHAPFTGVISDVFVEKYEFVSAGTPLLALTGTGMYETEVSVPAQFASYIQRGQVFTVDGEEVGHVDRFAPVLKNGAVEVTIALVGTSYMQGEVLSGTLMLTPEETDIFALDRNFLHFNTTGPYIRYKDGVTAPVSIVYDMGGTVFITTEQYIDNPLQSAVSATL